MYVFMGKFRQNIWCATGNILNLCVSNELLKQNIIWINEIISVCSRAHHIIVKISCLNDHPLRLYCEIII